MVQAASTSGFIGRAIQHDGPSLPCEAVCLLEGLISGISRLRLYVFTLPPVLCTLFSAEIYPPSLPVLAAPSTAFPTCQPPSLQSYREGQAGSSLIMHPTGMPPARHAGPAAPDITQAVTPALPEVIDPMPDEFAPARKQIQSAEHLKQFLTSDTVKQFVAFILALNEAVLGKKLSDPCPVSPVVAALEEVRRFRRNWVTGIRFINWSALGLSIDQSIV